MKNLFILFCVGIIAWFICSVINVKYFNTVPANYFDAKSDEVKQVLKFKDDAQPEQNTVISVTRGSSVGSIGFAQSKPATISFFNDGVVVMEVRPNGELWFNPKLKTDQHARDFIRTLNRVYPAMLIECMEKKNE